MPGGMERCMVAVDRDGKPRVPSEAAVMEYVLAMATGDTESRPKGGWQDYHNGPQAKYKPSRGCTASVASSTPTYRCTIRIQSLMGRCLRQLLPAVTVCLTRSIRASATGTRAG